MTANSRTSNSQESKIMCHKSTDLLLYDYYSTISCLCLDVVIGERAKRARHYQGCTNSSWCGIYMYGGTYAIIVAHATHTLCGWS